MKPNYRQNSRFNGAQARNLLRTILNEPHHADHNRHRLPRSHQEPGRDHPEVPRVQPPPIGPAEKRNRPGRRPAGMTERLRRRRPDGQSHRPMASPATPGSRAVIRRRVHHSVGDRRRGHRPSLRAGWRPAHQLLRNWYSTSHVERLCSTAKPSSTSCRRRSTSNGIASGRPPRFSNTAR